MKKTISILTAALAFAFSAYVQATTIEGFTPAGQFQTVGVTADGRLQVTNSSITAHIVVDAGQGGGTAVIVQNSSVTTPTAATFSVNSTPAVCYPAVSNRSQGIICNVDPSVTIFIGGPSATTSANHMTLTPGSCLSPDVPAPFTGALTCVSTAAALGNYLYFTP